ncbi:proline-tRNA ligase [Cladophialophora immunda]|uniref:proline--tRNA ligase n=1 Tax=Cladophialophora immunda TaxID=569365 RepID=A0A0D2B8G7_9EURO|nr:proline-tRNA ligase [Cladophialophora immunda]KIW33932.1 proline-tRNA ligase [Cladophialophora immunda]OQU94497.1 Anticodon binding domain-containing protein [Cladophialophora immunda]
MKLSAASWTPRRAAPRSAQWTYFVVRHSHISSTQRISDFWIPTVNVQKHDAALDATHLLIRAGYLRQAYAGIFQMLPLGLRVQEKLERLIDKHMRSVRASKVSLSSMSSQALWERSGRLKRGGEMFMFKDRRDTEWLLAPTHEEEITTLLADVIQTRQQLPVRLYQIGRKYRDEKRPRGGLLRGREFLMKDLYTFDSTPAHAHVTYDEIRGAYRNFLNELKIKYVEARAVSGDMGGNLSHEYHFPNFAGEDLVITCSECDYARNEEFVSQQVYQPEPLQVPEVGATHVNPSRRYLEEHFLSTDRRSLVHAIGPLAPDDIPQEKPSARSINAHAVKAVLNGVLDIDTGLEHPMESFKESLASSTADASGKRPSIYYVLDSRVRLDEIGHMIASPLLSQDIDAYVIAAPKHDTNDGINLLNQESGDPCPECGSGKLRVDKAIEIGHTFHLGTRYSSKLGLAARQSDGKEAVPVEMGCHGIGVSRLIAAVASCLSDEVGLNWPRVIAPFEAVIVVQPSHADRLRAAEQLCDQLSSSSLGKVDVVLDDRQEQGMGWKLKDADVIGYPVIVVVGKGFDQGKVEVQCRRLGVKQEVGVSDAVGFVYDLLRQL